MYNLAPESRAETEDEDALLDRLVDLQSACRVLAVSLCASDHGLQVHGSAKELLADVVPKEAGDPTVQRQIHYWQKRLENLKIFENIEVSRVRATLQGTASLPLEAQAAQPPPPANYVAQYAPQTQHLPLPSSPSPSSLSR